MELSETNLPTEIRALELELVDEQNKSITIVEDDHIELIVKALSSQTRRQILHQIQEPENGMDVSNIASNLKMTEANISAQIKKLEEAGLIYCEYCSGQHGVRKISKLKYNQLFIKF
jgi:predicted transcriptional regulator